MKFLPPDMTFAVDWALKTIIYYLSTPAPPPPQNQSMAHVSEKVVLVVLVLILCYR